MIPGSPLVDHFELDALGLDGPSEATVAAVDAEFELLLELYAGKGGKQLGAGVCTGVYFVCACCGCVFTRGLQHNLGCQSPPSTLFETRCHWMPCTSHGPQALPSSPYCRSHVAVPVLSQVWGFKFMPLCLPCSCFTADPSPPLSALVHAREYLRGI